MEILIPQIRRTCLVIFSLLLCFSVIFPNAIYAGNDVYCDDENNFIDDLSGYISGEIQNNIPEYQDLLTLAINPKKYISKEVGAAVQAAQQKAEEFVQQALDTLNAAEAAAEAAKQEAEDFANQVTEAADLAKQSIESAEAAVQAAQQAAEELAKEAEEAKVASEAAKSNCRYARN
jgi:methyl-accepting chemotaxis protein